MTNTLESPKTQFLTRLNCLKPFLPKNWREILMARNSKFDTKQGAARMNNTYFGRSNDYEILTFMEEITAEARAEHELMSDSNEYNESKYDNQDQNPND